MPRSGPLALLLPAAALALTGCGSSIEQGELESQVAAALEGETGVSPEVSCPGDLDAEVDASTECTATEPDTGREFTYRITVTSVDDGRAAFDIESVG
ncbi:DUF4333 domain-containing protein [Geodermatophilus sp. SYSU D00965]